MTDGLSNTLLMAERPASFDAWIGWWYAGMADNAYGTDSVIGAEDYNPWDSESCAPTALRAPIGFSRPK